MVDLNLWELRYPGVVQQFGTHESGHPFTRQVVIEHADVDGDDLPHPVSDGLVFGEDFARGMRLGFAGAHLSTLPQPAERRWTRPMDSAGVFEQAWRAVPIRRVAGAVAELANLDRGRMVYGRPRRYGPDLAAARKGWVTYACGFDAVDDRFYSTTEQVILAGVDAGSVAALTFPTSFPSSGVAPTESRSWVVNGGTEASWPIITLRHGGYPRLELLNDHGGVLWSVNVPAALAVDEEVTIDARPWVRQITRNGSPVPGLLRGSRITDLEIPAGVHELRLVATDPTGTAEAEVRWRDAFTGL